MKSVKTLLLLILSVSIYSQSPSGFSFQTIIRDTDGKVQKNQAVKLRFSILLSSESGTNVYSETHSKTTNEYGVINLTVGTGTPVTGNFASIVWGSNFHFLKTEIDPLGGINYTISSTSQLMSVPYAIYAVKSGSNLFEITAGDSNSIYNINLGNVGIGTNLPTEKLAVVGNIKSSENILGNSFIKVGGTSSQFLMADGSVNEELLDIITTMQTQITALQNKIIGITLPTVVIGAQTWTSINLNVSFYRDGTPIPEVRDSAEWANLTTGAWCHLNNDPANDAIYGKIYNHYAVTDPRGLAPAGYHIPTFAEYETMLDTIPPVEGCYDNRWYKAPALRVPGFFSGTNSSGFSALNGGSRTGDALVEPYPDESEPAGQFKTNWTSFWSSDAEGLDNFIILQDYCAIISISRPSNHGGYVRLIKN